MPEAASPLTSGAANLSPLASSLVKKALQALSGAGLALFLLLHLLGNSTILQGRQAFLTYTQRLHTLGPLLWLMELCLFFLFACHIGLGLRLTLDNRASRPRRYQCYRRRGTDLASRSMPYTGLVVLTFLLVHLVTLQRPKSPLPLLADRLARSLGHPAMAGFYLVALACLTLHASHGLWSLFQSLGLIAPRYDQPLRQAARLVSLVGGLLFMLIPLLALCSPDFLR